MKLFPITTTEGTEKVTRVNWINPTHIKAVKSTESGKVQIDMMDTAGYYYFDDRPINKFLKDLENFNWQKE